MRPLIVLILMLSTAALAFATIPDTNQSFAQMPDGPFPRFCMVVPDGSGPSLADARLEDGTTQSAVITLTLVNANIDPIPDYPAEDTWLENECGSIAFCANGTIADDSTDINGETTFSGPFLAGSHSSPGCGMLVMVAGSPLAQVPFDLRLNSPDINGDLEVQLTDIVLFTQAIANYAWSADLNSDGVINLSDITIMAQAIGAGCP